METKEFNLSEKAKRKFEDRWASNKGIYNVYEEEDVKEFIIKLKEEVGKYCNDKDKVLYVDMFLRDINKLAGEKLISQKKE